MEKEEIIQQLNKQNEVFKETKKALFKMESVSDRFYRQLKKKSKEIDTLVRKLIKTYPETTLDEISLFKKQ